MDRFRGRGLWLQILEVGSWGIRPKPWDELDLVANWQAFLSSPQRYLKHL